jgi:hypothetical protein
VKKGRREGERKESKPISDSIAVLSALGTGVMNKSLSSKIRRNKPIGIIIYIYTWKYHKETLYVAIFFSNRLKCHVFHFLFSLFFYKIVEQDGRTSPAQGRRMTTVGGGRWQGKGVGGEYGAKNVYTCM